MKRNLNSYLHIFFLFLFVTNLYIYFYHHFGIFRPVIFYTIFGLVLLVSFTIEKNRWIIIKNKLWILIIIILFSYNFIAYEFFKNYPLEYIRSFKFIVLGTGILYSLYILNLNLKLIFLFSLFLSSFLLCDFFFISEDYVSEKYLTSIYLNPNQVGAVLPILLVISLQCDNIADKLKLFLIIIVGIVILFTYSRSGYLAYLIALIYFSICKRHKKNYIIFSFFLVFTILILFVEKEILKLLASRNYHEKLGLGEVSIFLSGSTNVRFENLIYCWEKFLEKPFFGHGFQFFFEEGFIEGGRIVGPHNMFAKFAVERGIVGISIILLIFFLLSKYTCKKNRIVLLLIFTQSLFSHNLFENPTFIGFFSYVAFKNNFKFRLNLKMKENNVKI